MDQCGRSAIIRIFRLDNMFCPVLQCELWLSIRPSRGVAFFCYEDGSPLTGFQFSSVLKICLYRIGLAGYRFTSHSFHIGTATEAHRLGLDESIIRENW